MAICAGKHTSRGISQVFCCRRTNYLPYLIVIIYQYSKERQFLDYLYFPWLNYFLVKKMKYLYPVIPACLLFLLLLPACQLTDLSDLQPAQQLQSQERLIQYAEGTPIPDQYIVTFKDQAVQQGQLNTYPNDALRNPSPSQFGKRRESITPQALSRRETLMRQEISPLLKRHGLPDIHVKKMFTGRIKGMVMKLNATQLKELQSDEQVAFVEQDRLVALSITPDINTPFMPSQLGMGQEIIPYGIDRVGGSIDFSLSTNYIYRWAWIVDTGIDLDHPDLNVDPYFSANFTTNSSANDQHGHGTHVAGIVAAQNNGSGVTGVAAGAVVVAIKVLKNDGIGQLSDVIAGLNYVSMNAWPEDVVNVSLGGSPSPTLDNAILAIANAGIKVVVAAGNDGAQVNQTSPARLNHPQIYIIGAINDQDQYAGFSNYGHGVSYAAPGVDILSTYKNGGYAYVSGTSMAAPHLAGVLILTGNTIVKDGLSSPDPAGRRVYIPAH